MSVAGRLCVKKSRHGAVVECQAAATRMFHTIDCANALPPILSNLDAFVNTNNFMYNNYYVAEALLNFRHHGAGRGERADVARRSLNHDGPETM